MTFEIKIKMEVDGNKISVQNTLPFDANAQCILNALEETHRVIFGMLKKERKKGTPCRNDCQRPVRKAGINHPE